MTDDLIAFLNARLDEDEAAALRHACALDCMGRIHNDWHRVRLAREHGNTVEELASMGLGLEDVGAWRPDTVHTIHPAKMHGTALDPARVLREVKAKRQRVKHLADAIRQGHDDHDIASELLPLEALPYADHPDYRQEWAPEGRST